MNFRTTLHEATTWVFLQESTKLYTGCLQKRTNCHNVSILVLMDLARESVSQINSLLLNQRAGLVRPNEQKLQKFFEVILFSNEFYDYFQVASDGRDQGNISPNKINEYEIPLQPLTILKKFCGISKPGGCSSSTPKC
jgi:restriction endonuclease S subunit